MPLYEGLTMDHRIGEPELLEREVARILLSDVVSGVMVSKASSACGLSNRDASACLVFTFHRLCALGHQASQCRPYR